MKILKVVWKIKIYILSIAGFTYFWFYFNGRLGFLSEIGTSLLNSKNSSTNVMNGYSLKQFYKDSCVSLSIARDSCLVFIGILVIFALIDLIIWRKKEVSKSK